MSSVTIPDLNLAAHAVSLDYYDAVHIPLYPIFRPPNLSFFPARLWRPSHQACKKIQCPPSDTGSYTSFLLNGHLFHTSFLPIGHSQQPHSYVSPLTLLPARSSQPVRCIRPLSCRQSGIVKEASIRVIIDLLDSARK